MNLKQEIISIFTIDCKNNTAWEGVAVSKVNLARYIRNLIRYADI
jgi:hypothetical protein